jgi:hypothetical protein
LKRLIAGIATIALALVTVSFSATAASANVLAGTHTGNSLEELTVGVFADLDYSCTNDDPSWNVIVQTSDAAGLGPINIPPGMTWDSSTGHISGTPTTEGNYLLGQVWCLISDPNGNPLSEGNVLAGEIHVGPAGNPNPPVDPQPTVPAAEIWATPTRDNNCGFRVDILFPSAYPIDAGTAELKMSSGDNFVIFTANNPAQHEWFNASSWNLADSTADGSDGIWSKVDENGRIQCGQFIQLELSYRSGGLGSALAVALVFPVMGQSDNIFGEKSVYQNSCIVKAFFQFGGQPTYIAEFDDSSVVISYTEANGYRADFLLPRVWLGDNGYISFNETAGTISNSSFGASNMEAQLLSTAGTPGGCGTPGQLFFSYQNLYTSWAPFPQGANADVAALEGCGLGSFAGSLFVNEQDECTTAPIGTFVSTKGSKTPTSCPTGMTTEFMGSASPNDCYKPITQTTKALTAVKVMKFGKVLTLPGVTDQGNQVKVLATGTCRVTGIMVKGLPKLKITAGKKAGYCTLKINAPAKGKVANLVKTQKIKVSQTGK